MPNYIYNQINAIMYNLLQMKTNRKETNRRERYTFSILPVRMMSDCVVGIVVEKTMQRGAIKYSRSLHT